MNTFQIIGDGVALDVAEDSRLVTEFVASTFNEDTVFAGSYTYPVTFPFTPKNEKFFGYAHHLENREARVPKEVGITLMGISWKLAVVEYEVSDAGYEGVLKVDSGSVADSMREVTISDVFAWAGDGTGRVSFKSIKMADDAAGVTAAMLSMDVYDRGYAFPSHLNAMADGELETVVNNSIINNFDNMSQITDDRLYSPWFFHVWVIRSVCAYMGFKAVGNYLDNEFVQSLLIYNSGMRTGADWKEIREIKPAQHLPKIGIGEYIKAIRNDHRVIVYFDSLTKTAHFEMAETVLHRRESIDLSDVQVDGSLRNKRMPDTAYRLVTKTDDSDEIYNFLPYEKYVTVGYNVSKWKDLPLRIGTLFMYRGPLLGMSNIVIPQVRQLGNIYTLSYNVDATENVFNGGNVYNKNEYQLRMVSWKGRQSLQSGYHIPFATSTTEGNAGVQYTTSLNQGGVAGLVNQMTLYWYQYYCLSEQVEVSAQMNVLHFFGLSPIQKVVIADKNRVRIEALMDKIVFEPIGNLVIGKLTCYPNYSLVGGNQNMRVVVGESVIENKDGKVYAKLIMHRGRRDEHNLYANVILYFYADEYGTIPMSVSALSYNLEIRYYSVKGVYQSSTTASGTANGTEYSAGEFVRMYLNDYSTNRTFLRPVDTSKVIVIGNYKQDTAQVEVMVE